MHTAALASSLKKSFLEFSVQCSSNEDGRTKLKDSLTAHSAHDCIIVHLARHYKLN